MCVGICEEVVVVFDVQDEKVTNLLALIPALVFCYYVLNIIVRCWLYDNDFFVGVFLSKKRTMLRIALNVLPYCLKCKI